MRMFEHVWKTEDLRLLEFFCSSEDHNMRRAVALNPSATPAMLLELAMDWNEYVRMYAGANKSCPPEAIAILLNDPVPEVRWQLAANPALPPDLLRKLAESNLWETSTYLVRNPNCPEDVMLQIAEKGDPGSRAFLASTTTNVNLLEALIDSDVRNLVAANGCTPWPIVLELLRDDDVAVRKGALTNPQCPVSFLVEAAQSYDFDIWEALAGNPRTPTHILSRLANYPYSAEEYREDFGDDDPGWLSQFAPTTFNSVLMALASNPMVPVEVLVKLANHEDDAVATRAFNNPGPNSAQERTNP